MNEYGLINIDFKWNAGEISMLEMGDAINDSGFMGYNVLYSPHHLSGDEVMLRKMIAHLKSQFDNVYFIYNGQSESYWPFSQFPNVLHFKTIFDFLCYAQAAPELLKNDIILKYP